MSEGWWLGLVSILAMASVATYAIGSANRFAATAKELARAALASRRFLPMDEKEPEEAEAEEPNLEALRDEMVKQDQRQGRGW